MEKIINTEYNLTRKEVEKVNFTIRFITDRQNRPSYFFPGIGNFVQSYAGCHRQDMYWIDCFLEGENLGSLVIEPYIQKPERFCICKNHNKVFVGYQELVDRAKKWFLLQPEYNQQVIWATELAKKIKKDEEEIFKDTLVSK